MISITKIINWKQETGSLPFLLAYKKVQIIQDQTQLQIKDVFSKKLNMSLIQGYAIAGKNTNTLHLNCQIPLQNLQEIDQNIGYLKIHLEIGQSFRHHFSVNLSQILQQKTQYFVFDENSKILQIDLLTQKLHNERTDVSIHKNQDSGIQVLQPNSFKPFEMKNNEQMLTSYSQSSPTKRSVYESNLQIQEKQRNLSSSETNFDLLRKPMIKSAIAMRQDKSKAINNSDSLKVLSLFKQFLHKSPNHKNSQKFASNNVLNLKTLRILSNQQKNQENSNLKRAYTYRSIYS